MRKVFDLSDNPWPLTQSYNKIRYAEAQLHKEATVWRFGGETFVASSGQLASSGIRVILETATDLWYRIDVSARLIKGDSAFVLAQDLDVVFKEKDPPSTDSVTTTPTTTTSTTSTTIISPTTSNTSTSTTSKASSTNLVSAKVQKFDLLISGPAGPGPNRGSSSYGNWNGNLGPTGTVVIGSNDPSQTLQNLLERPTIVRLNLKKHLLPRHYLFYRSIDAKTTYRLYFKARSYNSIVGILFYNKDIEYELAISDFSITEIGLGITLVQEFPLLETLSAGLSSDLRRFGIGIYPSSIEEKQLQVLGIDEDHEENRKISVYLLTIGNDIWFYFHEFQTELSFELVRPPYLISLLSLKIAPKKHKITINSKPAVAEFRDDLILLYIENYKNFYPSLLIDSFLFKIDLSK